MGQGYTSGVAGMRTKEHHANMNIVGAAVTELVEDGWRLCAREHSEWYDDVEGAGRSIGALLCTRGCVGVGSASVVILEDSFSTSVKYDGSIASILLSKSRVLLVD